MQVTCYYDYTCPYSWRAYRWLGATEDAGADVTVKWRTFSLKEARRTEGVPLPFDEEPITSVSLLALALAHAARHADFLRYHDAVFATMHSGTGRHLTEEDLLVEAAGAGVDVARFDREQSTWLAAVAAEHQDGVRRYGLFGTPTLVVENGATAFVKLAEVPTGSRATELWSALCTLATYHPELLELKRP